MINALVSTPFFGFTISIAFYLIGTVLYKRNKFPLFNPLVFAIICVIILLMLTDVSYETYNEGGRYISIWVTPTTVALAIKLEKNFKYLKESYPAILTGIITGVLFHTVLVTIFALLFRFDYPLAATFIPKPVTTAIAIGISESVGGLVPLTVAIVVFTGVIGALIGPSLFKMAQITNPVAQGIAFGASSHAMGTSKAIEVGEVQGAMSGLAIVVTGIVIVVIAPIGAQILQLFY
ncbi:LrgB family protein [Aerococcaceae bacterium WGS1372]